MLMDSRSCGSPDMNNITPLSFQGGCGKEKELLIRKKRKGFALSFSGARMLEFFVSRDVSP